MNPVSREPRTDATLSQVLKPLLQRWRRSKIAERRAERDARRAERDKTRTAKLTPMNTSKECK